MSTKYRRIFNLLTIIIFGCALVSFPVALWGIGIGLVAIGFAIYARSWVFCAIFVAATILCTLSYSFYRFVLLPTAEARAEREKTNTAIYNLEVLEKSLQGYSKEHGNRLPAAENWCDILIAYDSNLTKDNFRHPKLEGTVVAFNRALSGVDVRKIPQNTIILFEARGGWNLYGGRELVQPLADERVYVEAYVWGKGVKSYWINKNGIKNWCDNIVPVYWQLPASLP